MATEVGMELPQGESAQVDITVHISAKLNVTQVGARRKVNVFVSRSHAVRGNTCQDVLRPMLFAGQTLRALLTT